MIRLIGRLISCSEDENCFEDDDEHGSFNNNSTTSALPVLKEFASGFFSPALSLDILFCKKPICCSQAAVALQETTSDWLDDLSSDENIDLLCNSHGQESESLKKINALWNENYPTVRFRKCSSVSSDEIQQPTIKVNFAARPHFLTFHIVGTEERNGNWRHVIRERENFERRILELENNSDPSPGGQSQSKGPGEEKQ